MLYELKLACLAFLLGELCMALLGLHSHILNIDYFHSKAQKGLTDILTDWQ